MKATGHYYCEAMHEICNDLTSGYSDPIKNNVLRDLVK